MLLEQEFKQTRVAATFVPTKDNGVHGPIGLHVLLHLEHQFKPVHESVLLETAKEDLRPNLDHVSFMILNQPNLNGEHGVHGALAVPAAVVVQ